MTLTGRFTASRFPLATVALATLGLLAVVTAAPLLRTTMVEVANPVPLADAGFGYSQLGLPDIDGDGVADFAVSAPGAERVDILSGATRTLIRSIVDPNFGPTEHQFGFAMADAGDLNGDGVSDLAIGAPGPFMGPIALPCPGPPCPVPDPVYGRAFVFSGATGALLRTIVPADDFAGFGFSVASLGDVNGDGVPDLAVGMVYFASVSSFGRVYAFSGATNTQLWVVDEPGGRQYPSFGLKTAAVADLNGDGRRDLLVGAPYHDADPDPGTFVLTGRAYLVSGATGGVLRTHADPTVADQSLFGLAVAGAGDQDGDGAEDYVIGEPGAGTIHLVSGKTGATVRTVAGAAAGDRFGFALASVGDQDGDGHADFWVGAPGASKAYLSTWAGAILATVTDPAASGPVGAFGWSLARLGNLGGDSADDAIVGKPSHASGSGAAYLVLLAANKLPTAEAGPDQVIECTAATGTAVTLDGSASADADGDALTYEWRDQANAVIGTSASVTVTLGLGTHVFTLRVSDGFGGEDTDSVSITVGDTTAPTVGLTVSPAVLSPPNHRLVPIIASLSVIDACDASPSVRLVSIVSNEPDNGLGDGDTTGDIQVAATGTDDRAFLLRAERSGLGAGRIYTVTYRASDASSNGSLATTRVVVPH